MYYYYAYIKFHKLQERRKERGTIHPRIGTKNERMSGSIVRKPKHPVYPPFHHLEKPISRRRPRLLSPAEVRIIMFEFIDSGAPQSGREVRGWKEAKLEGMGSRGERGNAEGAELGLIGAFVWKCLRGVISRLAFSSAGSHRATQKSPPPSPTPLSTMERQTRDENRRGGILFQFLTTHPKFLLIILLREIDLRVAQFRASIFLTSRISNEIAAMRNVSRIREMDSSRYGRRFIQIMCSLAREERSGSTEKLGRVSRIDASSAFPLEKPRYTDVYSSSSQLTHLLK